MLRFECCITSFLMPLIRSPLKNGEFESGEVRLIGRKDSMTFNQLSCVSLYANSYMPAKTLRVLNKVSYITLSLFSLRRKRSSYSKRGWVGLDMGARSVAVLKRAVILLASTLSTGT